MNAFVVLGIAWTIQGTPQPPFAVKVDLPFGASVGAAGEACAAAQLAWMDMAVETLLAGPHSSMGMRFTCKEGVEDAR